MSAPRTTISSPPDELSCATVSLADLQPTLQQKRAALLVVAILCLGLGCTAPFAATPLPRFAAFIPFLNAAILVTGLITAMLLFVQFSISRSYAILVLAGGYLFTALIVIPHALTFPGAFSPAGLLGAGLQTTASLYVLWHIGFAAAVLVYAGLKEGDRARPESVRSAIWRCVALAAVLVGASVWVSIGGESSLPLLFLSDVNYSALASHALAFTLSICVLALALLWIRRRSVLDLWLMVVTCALIGELALTVVRFSLGFYVSRLFSLATATIVLIILLAEAARLYSRLVDANRTLLRERDNKLADVEAVVASISHEVKQPLSAIVMRGSSARRYLEDSPPNLDKARTALNAIVADGRRASEIFENIRSLFRGRMQERVPVNVNELVSDVMEMMRDELAEHRIIARTELVTGALLVLGHRGQLEEVLLNLIRNAIDAMEGTEEARRLLRLRVDDRGLDGASIEVMDAGSGIDPDRLESIFDAFFTTKSRGMGLGLAICRMIVERHGGKLLASSEQGAGAVFQVILPTRSPVALTP
jgi:signal transduction histidine kinase